MEQRVIPFIPPVDLHWFFEISIRTEKKIQLVYTWGINLCLEKVQVKIQVRIKPDIFLRFN